MKFDFFIDQMYRGDFFDATFLKRKLVLEKLSFALAVGTWFYGSTIFN